jgi:hypothetical protein
MTEQNGQPGTAVARQQTQVALGSPIGDLDQAYRLSQALALAEIVPDKLRGKPGNVLAIMLYGQDLGMSPMQAIQGIYVVKGKPQLSGTTWLALARRAGHKVRFLETTNERCTIEITRADDPRHPHVESYTLEDAVTANLVRIKDGKPYARGTKGDPLPWEQYTRTMIRNRCISNAAKAACPEVALGFAVEGDYDYIAAAADDVAPPEHHGDVVDAELVPERVDAEVADLAQQFDFSVPAAAAAEHATESAELPPPPADYECSTCEAIGEHYEDECPKAATPQ